jgi:GNAT superfamily N-acetyltransferase
MDAASGLHIREMAPASGANRVHGYLNGELVAALDFVRVDREIRINLIFVKPRFRRQGIGRALLAQLDSLYPGAKIVCGKRQA